MEHPPDLSDALLRPHVVPSLPKAIYNTSKVIAQNLDYTRYIWHRSEESPTHISVGRGSVSYPLADISVFPSIRLVKNLPAMQETWVQARGQEDSPGEGNGNPLQSSCLENLMDGGAWWATVHGVSKSWARLRDFTFFLSFIYLSASFTFGFVDFSDGGCSLGLETAFSLGACLLPVSEECLGWLFG